MNKQDLYDAIPAFVEQHWPKNDTAAHGGPATPGRGEAAVAITRFIIECVPDDDKTAVPWGDLDPEIASAVHALADYEIDTFSSCQGGEGHASLMPEILFHGDEHQGLWAVWLLEQAGFGAWELSRHWVLDHGVPRHPFWRVTIRRTDLPGPRRRDVSGA